MKHYRKIITFIFLLVFKTMVGQTFEKKFEGYWGDTFWEFEFSKNGYYKRISNGHYGNTVVEGKYTMKNDTIHLKTGFKNTNGTVNEFYAFDNDTILVDLSLGYGYPIQKKSTSKFEELIYPKIRSVNKIDEIKIEKFLNQALNSESVKQFFHFQELSDRNFLIAQYYKLNASIEVDGKKAVFKPKDQITEKFYIEFKEIYLGYSIFSLKIIIHGEGVTIDTSFQENDGIWKQYTNVKEN